MECPLGVRLDIQVRRDRAIGQVHNHDHFDTTAYGRTVKLLNVIDEFTRETLAIVASTPVASPMYSIALSSSMGRRARCASTTARSS
jgi:hypothetical protein